MSWDCVSHPGTRNRVLIRTHPLSAAHIRQGNVYFPLFLLLFDHSDPGRVDYFALRVHYIALGVEGLKTGSSSCSELKVLGLDSSGDCLGEKKAIEVKGLNSGTGDPSRTTTMCRTY